MFYRLHRLAKLLGWIFVLGIFAFVWQQRAVFEPILVWYQVYDNGGIEITEQLPRVQGRAFDVADGQTVRLRTADRRYYLVRLAGLEAPVPPLSPAEQAREKQRREELRSLVLSNWVHVEVTYADNNSVLGVLHANDININLHFITNGLATLNRDYIKRMPRDIQYNFFAAARAHEKRQEGEPRVAAAK